MTRKVFHIPSKVDSASLSLQNTKLWIWVVQRVADQMKTLHSASWKLKHIGCQVPKAIVFLVSLCIHENSSAKLCYKVQLQKEREKGLPLPKENLVYVGTPQQYSAYFQSLACTSNTQVFETFGKQYKSSPRELLATCQIVSITILPNAYLSTWSGLS